MIDPPPLTVQLNAGCEDRAAPNWSFAVAVNCCVPFGTTEAVAGETEALVDVWLTVTVTGDVAVPPCGSLIVAVIVYDPAAVNVAVLVDAALVPLGENDTPAAGLEDHVYVSVPVPEPATLRLVVVPVTGFGDAAAGVVTMGRLYTVSTAPFDTTAP